MTQPDDTFLAHLVQTLGSIDGTCVLVATKITGREPYPILFNHIVALSDRANEDPPQTWEDFRAFLIDALQELKTHLEHCK